MINGIEEQAILDIVIDRERNGFYKDMFDLIHRVPIGIEQMRILIRADVFAFSGRNKLELLWEVHALLQPVKKLTKTKELFEIRKPSWKIPKLYHTDIDIAFEEMELFGFPFCSPFTLLSEVPEKGILARDLKHNVGKMALVIAYMITVKYSSTAKGERMYFGTFIDEEGNWIDTVHFPQSAALYPFTGRGTYALYGKVVEEYDFICIEIQTMKRLPMVDREKQTEEVFESNTLGAQ